LPRRVDLLIPPPRRLPRLAIAASVAVHVVLFLTVSVEGRLFEPPPPDAPRVTIVELPPLGDGVVGPAPSAATRPPAGRRSAAIPAPAPQQPPVLVSEEPADSAARAPVATGSGRIRPGLAQGKLWVSPLPLPPRELAQRLTRSHVELVDSTVDAIIQTFLDSVALDPASRGAQLPSWTTTVAGSKFGLDSKWIYVAGLRIPAAVLALLPLPATGNESRAFDRSGEMYQDLRRAARRAETLDEFKGVIREIRERKEREREFERNRRTPPPRPSLEPDD
jgi:hypothetical protein